MANLNLFLHAVGPLRFYFRIQENVPTKFLASEHMNRLPTTLLKIVLLLMVAVANTAAQQAIPKVDLAKKIAEATPPSLPQTPMARKPANAVQNPDYVGKVKRIVYSSRDSGVAELMSTYEMDFDNSGNFTRTVSYYEGYPYRVTVWGFIDGFQVSRSNLIVYSPGERPATKVRMMEDQPRNPNTPGDPRYDQRSVIEYDELGRVTRWISYRNNGEEKIRMIFTYASIGREQRTILEGGDQEYAISDPQDYETDLLDKDNRVVESWSHGKNGSVTARFRYTYEFDAKHNWITRSTFKIETVDGKETLNLLRILFRTITYYH